jgi:predicted nucleotidyltransferase
MEEVQDAVKNQLLEEKHRTLDEFLRRLKKQAVWERIAKVILYGSVLRRERH